MITKIEIFFSNLFSPIILKNKIVATVLYKLSLQIKEINNKIDLIINDDI